MTASRDFWSRRKAAVAAEAEDQQAAQESDEQTADRARLAEMSDEEVLAELDLPAPETLSRGDDFSVFMKRSVPDRLRRRALRALWRSNPVLANVDGLVDYDAEYSDSAMVVQDMQTAYQVGKGMLAHVQALALTGSGPDEPEDGPGDGDETVEPDTCEPDWSPPVAEAPEADRPDTDADASPAPRRMTFSYAGETG